MLIGKNEGYFFSVFAGLLTKKEKEPAILLVKAKNFHLWELPGDSVSWLEILNHREKIIFSTNLFQVLFLILGEKLTEHLGLRSEIIRKLHPIGTFLKTPIFLPDDPHIRDIPCLFVAMCPGELLNSLNKGLPNASKFEEWAIVKKSELSKYPLVGRRMKRMVNCSFYALKRI